jgi:hypothetical protein
MVEMVKQAKERSGLGTKNVCRAGALPYSSVRRWEGRLDAGLAPVQPRGPRPVEPEDWAALLGRILALHHGRKRTHGTGNLVAGYRGKASRRQVLAMVAAVRSKRNRQADAARRRLEWHQPGTVWATDTTEIEFPGSGKFQAQTVRDLPSRYLFAPGTDHVPSGAEIAAWLEELFKEHGAPLFLKLDNAANENAREVLDLLGRWHVIPLNSPKGYPQYNGGIEHDQGELQAAALAVFARNPGSSPEHRGLCAALGAQDLNHNGRDSLRGKCSCRVFNPGRRRSMFTRRQRKEVAVTVTSNAAAILGGIADPTPAQAAKAWRLAVEQWLFDAGFVTEKAS